MKLSISDAIPLSVCAAALFGAFALSPIGAAANSPADAAPPSSQSPYLIPSPDVSDPVLALLVGLFDQNRFGEFPRQAFATELRRRRVESRVPLEQVRSIRRAKGEAPVRATVAASLDGEGVLRIPYQILGYYPGKLRTSENLEMVEWHLGDVRYRVPGRNRDEVLRDVKLWGIRKGRAEMDIDGWLDAFMGSKLDDTRLTGLALFEHDGRRIAMAIGFNSKGKGHSGAFDLRRDKILFPHPPEFRAAGSLLRSRLERLLPGTRSIRDAAAR